MTIFWRLPCWRKVVSRQNDKFSILPVYLGNWPFHEILPSWRIGRTWQMEIFLNFVRFEKMMNNVKMTNFTFLSFWRVLWIVKMSKLRILSFWRNGSIFFCMYVLYTLRYLLAPSSCMPRAIPKCSCRCEIAEFSTIKLRVFAIVEELTEIGNGR